MALNNKCDIFTFLIPVYIMQLTDLPFDILAYMVGTGAKVYRSMLAIKVFTTGLDPKKILHYMKVFGYGFEVGGVYYCTQKESHLVSVLSVHFSDVESTKVEPPTPEEFYPQITESPFKTEERRMVGEECVNGILTTLHYSFPPGLQYNKWFQSKYPNTKQVYYYENNKLCVKIVKDRVLIASHYKNISNVTRSSYINS